MATTLHTSSESSSTVSVNGQAHADSASRLSEQTHHARFWRGEAPQGAATDDGWAAWARHLSKRRAPKSLADLCNTAESPLGWGFSSDQLAPPTVELLALVENLSKSTKGKSRASRQDAEQILVVWLSGTSSQSHTIDFALQCLAVANALPSVADQVRSGVWYDLLDALWQIVHSAGDWRIDSELPPEEGLAQQLLAGELPLTLAHLFPEMRPVHKLHAAARDALSDGVEELLNGNGLVRGPYLAVFRPLLACWTRCRALGESHKKNCWKRKAQEQYEWLATHALGLSSARGTTLLGQPRDMAWTPDFLRTVVRLGGDAADVAAARSIFGKKLTSALRGKNRKRVPDTSEHCEWSGLAYMRTQWQRSAPIVAIDYATPKLRLEVWSGPERLISGAWTWETKVDGRRLEPVGAWEETCWFSDEDVDYLELAIDLTGDARLERQILLAREELFLLLADYVINADGEEISHRYRLPLAAKVEFEPEKETREGLLKAGKATSRVLPLALPEWRTDPRIGELTASDGKLQLAQERPGRNLACPLLIDLDKSRAKKQCTWRQLTVAQALEIQPHDVAVGYRAQCGKDQWLIYRSLDEPANRTLIGQNLSLECLVGRFLAPSGEVDELLEVEGSMD